MQVHKGRLKAVPQKDLPLDIRIAAKRQRRTFHSWQLGLGPEVLYTPTSRPTPPSTLPPGAVQPWLRGERLELSEIKSPAQWSRS